MDIVDPSGHTGTVSPGNLFRSELVNGDPFSVLVLYQIGREFAALLFRKMQALNVQFIKISLGKPRHPGKPHTRTII